MFLFCVLMVIITYPIVFLGSVICGILIAILSDGNPATTPNPFVSPAKVYRVYRDCFTKWSTGLAAWYKEESSK